MPTRLYCLLPASADAVPPPPVRPLVVGGLVAWVGTVADIRLPRDRDALVASTLDHDRVISAALASGVTPVPAALGDGYESDQAVAEDLTARHGSIEGDLARVAGTVEMAVVVAPARATGVAGQPSGRAYLEAIRDRPHRLREVVLAMEARVAGLVRERRSREGEDRQAVSHLIMADAVERYRTALASFTEPGVRVVVDGPRPPYSFASYSSRSSSS